MQPYSFVRTPARRAALKGNCLAGNPGLIPAEGVLGFDAKCYDPIVEAPEE